MAKCFSFNVYFGKKKMDYIGACDFYHRKEIQKAYMWE